MTDKRGAAPTITPEQRAAGLIAAAEARTERALLKRDIRDGKIDPAALARIPAGPAGRMRMYEFLTSCRNIGPATARRVIREVGATESRRLRGLGPRQREQLAVIVERIGAGDCATVAISASKGA